PAWARVLRWAFAGWVTVSFMTTFTIVLIGDLHRFPRLFEVMGIANGIVCIACFVIMAGAGIPIEPPKARQKSIGRMARWLWNGRFGAWLAKIITPRNVAVPEAHFRPTELAPGVAVDELFAALPTAYPEHPRDLPIIRNR